MRVESPAELGIARLRRVADLMSS
jgi:catechol 2,3-dioxygenase-like lactoylglutathione lyase family enzyme